MRIPIDPLRHFVVSEEGPTSVEYAVMLALIVLTCFVAIQLLGQRANTIFTNLATDPRFTGTT